jgi:hypothetical protein
MDNLLIALAVAIFLPAVFALGALIFYTVQYVRLRRGRKDTWVDYLHDFAGSWTRLITRTDRPEELRYLKKMLLAGACFVAYVSVVMAVVGDGGRCHLESGAKASTCASGSVPSLMPAFA